MDAKVAPLLLVRSLGIAKTRWKVLATLIRWNA